MLQNLRKRSSRFQVSQIKTGPNCLLNISVYSERVKKTSIQLHVQRTTQTEDLLIFWPPGPEPLTNCSSKSDSRISIAISVEPDPSSPSCSSQSPLSPSRFEDSDADDARERLWMESPSCKDRVVSFEAFKRGDLSSTILHRATKHRFAGVRDDNGAGEN